MKFILQKIEYICIMEEIWKDVIGYEDLYQVSSYGRAKSLDRYVKCNNNGGIMLQKGKNLKFGKTNVGYHYINLSKENIKKKGVIHRLVAEAFIPNPENKPCINHLDGNKENNRVENLQWVTYSENSKHAHDNSLTPKPPIHAGEKCHLSILDEENVINIRKLLNEGELSQKEIGKLFNITQANVSDIKLRNTWKHI